MPSGKLTPWPVRHWSWSEERKETSLYEDRDIDIRIILKLILNKQGVTARSGLNLIFVKVKLQDPLDTFMKNLLTYKEGNFARN